jgi:hypothetical protein
MGFTIGIKTGCTGLKGHVKRLPRKNMSFDINNGFIM